MSETMLGIMIGGIVGMLPAIITAVLSIVNERKQEDFQLRLEYVHIYENARKQALEKFIAHLGAMAANNTASDFTFDSFLASAYNAKIYVSDKTALIINDMIGEVKRIWDNNQKPQWDGVQATNLIHNEIYLKIDRYIKNELESPLPQNDSK